MPIQEVRRVNAPGRAPQECERPNEVLTGSIVDEDRLRGHASERIGQPFRIIRGAACVILRADAVTGSQSTEKKWEMMAIRDHHLPATPCYSIADKDSS